MILLGNPEDNPLIAFLAKEKFLPYAPDAASFPGPGRGYIAWHRDGVGPARSRITLIAYDEAGMAEAVGSVYEAVAGIEPLTRWIVADTAKIRPANATALPPHLKPAMGTLSLRMPDRVVALKFEGKDVTAVSHDGTLTRPSAKKPPPNAPPWLYESKVLSVAEMAKFIKDATVPLNAKHRELVKKQVRPDRLQSVTAAGADYVAVAYWGGWLRVVDNAGRICAEQRMRQDITAMAWHGNRLSVGLANGEVSTFLVK